MSLKNLTWDKLVHRLNDGKTYGHPISIQLLRTICLKGDLKDSSVHFILGVYINSHPLSTKVELLKSLIRNPHITLDSKVEVLSFFLFKLEPMKKSESKKRSLALEVLDLCKESPRHRIKVLAMIEDMRLKGLSRISDQNERKKLNVISQESAVLSGISTRNYSTYDSNNLHLLKIKDEIQTAAKEQKIEREELTFERLSEFFESNSGKARTLTSTISNRLNEPWGVDVNSILWNLKNLGDFDSTRFNFDENIVRRFILEYFGCELFISRLTSKTLMNSKFNFGDFSQWRKLYGRSFLLSERNFVPRDFGKIYSTFQEFVERVNPSDLFLRKTYGLKYILGDKQVNTFLYFMKTPNLNKRNSGNYLVVIFYVEKMPKKLMTFLELQDIESYLKTHVKAKNSLKMKIPYCYVKECKKAETAIETIALLQLEVPFQFLESSYKTLHQIEVYHPSSELRKRKEFLDFLQKKKLAITRVRNRESDIHCINCNQPLTDQISRIRGYGPECWRKLKHLNITNWDINSSSDVFERYATQDFEAWLRHIQSIIPTLPGQGR